MKKRITSQFKCCRHLVQVHVRLLDTHPLPYIAYESVAFPVAVVYRACDHETRGQVQPTSSELEWIFTSRLACEMRTNETEWSLTRAKR
jgi:hypothetical protein